MKKLLKFFLITAILFSTCAITTHNAKALSGADFNPGYIIDDAVFYNENALDSNGIQSFLNAQMPNCDTSGSKPAREHGRSDITRAQYAASVGWHGPPYVCLRDYKQDTPLMEAASGLCGPISGKSNQSAAQIIDSVSKACHISPHVLLVLLQKEQSLVTDTWPLNSQYRNATGFACPDTAPCNPAYGGFFYQVYHAARQFQVYKAKPNNYNYVAGRVNNIYYNPDLSRCGSSPVFIQNQATAALYIYTPYQPNASALNNLYGTGDSCGAYGNRNFWRLFNDWFGSTTIQVLASFAERHKELGGNNGILGRATSNQVCGLPNGGCYQGFQNGGLYWSPQSGTFESYGKIRTRYVELGADRSTLGYPNEHVICGLPGNGCYQRYQNGVIYMANPSANAYENKGDIRKRFVALGAESGALGYPNTGEFCQLKNGGCYQGFQNGSIYWSPATGAHENIGQIRQRYVSLSTENGILGYPTSAQTCSSNGPQRCYQMYQGGGIYYSEATGARSVSGGIFAKWDSFGKEWGKLGYPTSNEIYGLIKNGSYQLFENGSIYWTASGGKFVLDSIEARWSELQKENGKLGYPITDTLCGTKNNGCYQIFNGGNTIYWTPATGAKTVWGAIYSEWDRNGKEWGKLGYPTSNEYYEGASAKQEFEGGIISWNNSIGTSIIYR